MLICVFFFFKQKTAYEMRISDWSSDVCSSDLLTIIGATSGDTGSAAIDALAGREHVDVFMLHPAGRVSDVQRRQMTTVLAPNIHNIAIQGSFDDAQAMVKAAFNDKDFAARFQLGEIGRAHV